MLPTKALRDERLHGLAQKIFAHASEQAFRLRVDEDDPAPAIDDDHGVRRALQESAELRLRCRGRKLSLPTSAPLGRVPQLALDGRDQACELALEKVIVHAEPHGFYRDIFANGAGYDDEGDVGPPLA